MPEPQRSIPLAYLLTFTCYGTWLHGRASGSVDARHNNFGAPFIPADPRLMVQQRAKLVETPFLLDAERRRIVLKTIREVATHRDWVLLAAHVRANHIHLVLQGAADPDKMLDDFKAYATRRLKEAGFDALRKRRWTEGGSTRFLWDTDAIERAVRYVIDEQGDPMEVYETGTESIAKTEPVASARASVQPDLQSP